MHIVNPGDVDKSHSLASLCTNCLQIFHKHHSISKLSVLIAPTAISLIKSQCCRVCSIIWSRHMRFVKRNDGLGEKLNLLQVCCRLDRPDDRELHGAGLELALILEYANGLREWISLAVISANIADQLFLTQCLPPSTGSKVAIDFLKSRFRHCQESHQLCHQMFNLEHAWYPSRLLEIKGMDRQTVYLRNRGELTSRPYFTLSHCWGNRKPFQLTRDTEALLRAGISTDSLPKTFRDAILITSQFSVLYIWIDSLCIFQDDLKDWDMEAAAMREVYSYALCNIAATGASNGSDGLFFEREPTAESPFWVQTNWVVKDVRDEDEDMCGEDISCPAGIYEIFPCDQWTQDLEKGPLNRRAWVMQERFLSTRILHFSASQVFWECLENRSGELFPNTIPKVAQPYWFLDSQNLKRTLFKAQRDDEWQEELYRSWQVFVRAYSRSGLSQESDKLVAINGVQQMLSKITGEVFIGGIWRSRLIQELCWIQNTTKREQNMFRAFYPQSWRAPTWSWASSNVAMHPGPMRHHIDCQNLQTRVAIEKIDIDAFSSGKLKHASLTLRGKLLHATFIIQQTPSDPLYAPTELICGSSSLHGKLCHDWMFQVLLDKPVIELPFQEEIVCLGMFSCKCIEEDTDVTRYLVALALKPHHAANGQYERVGVVTIPESAFDFYIANEIDVEQSLVLV